MNHTLLNLLGDFLPDGAASPAADRHIAGISADSRAIGPGYLFFALPGDHADGHDFIPQVLAAGAAAVVHERELAPALQEDAAQRRVTLVHVPHGRSALSRAAAAWYGYPAQALRCIGVTGTDGKSSTTYFTHQLLELAGHTSGFFSTVAWQTAERVEANGLRQSTPEAPQLHEVMARMRDNGKEFAVIEATSHGLSHRTARLRDVPFQVAVFTNLSHEHLEFHGSYEQYRSDKANLFRELNGPAGHPLWGIVNAGDAEADYFASAAVGPVAFYGSEMAAPAQDRRNRSALALYAREIRAGADHCRFTLEYRPDAVAGHGGAVTLPGTPGELVCRLPLPGAFNVENIMAALLAAAVSLGRSPLELAGLLGSIKGIKGRMVPVDQGQPFSLVVDYAHTPGAYARILPMFRASTVGRLIAVFGSAGERDIEKRPMQGALAAEHCDILVLTNEDPRLEDENTIIKQIQAGAAARDPGKEIHCCPDRRQAIRLACELARDGDLVVLLGKGHEQCIFRAGEKLPWDEETVAREVLQEMGFRGRDAQ